jgi:hypothetical protein
MITVRDDMTREEAIEMARILAKALHHERAHVSQLRREYHELMEFLLSRADAELEALE